MNFNPSKYLHLTITYQQTSHNYHICGQLIQRVSKAIYLGVLFDLNWKHHIANVCIQANATNSFLRRNITHCLINIRGNSFVRPILEYAYSVWSPYLQTDIQQIEKFNVVQHALYWMTTHGTVV